MGDFDDLGSTSERRLLNSPDLHDSTIKTLNELYDSNVKRLAREMMFMKGKLIGLLEGNHYGVYPDGSTTTQRLCRILECKYLGVNSFIRLIFIQKGSPKNTRKVDIFAHHGRGGGRTKGASANPVYNMSLTAEADIYLMGDNHQKFVDSTSRLKLSDSGANMRLSHRKIILARTGSFLKGYEPEVSSYIVDAGLPPTELGTVKIEMTPRHVRDGGDQRIYIDLHAST